MTGLGVVKNIRLKTVRVVTSDSILVTDGQSLAKLLTTDPKVRVLNTEFMCIKPERKGETAFTSAYKFFVRDDSIIVGPPDLETQMESFNNTECGEVFSKLQNNKIVSAIR